MVAFGDDLSGIDQCDGYGQCVGGTTTGTEADCAFATACNTTTFDPEFGTCSYSEKCGDGFCGIDDMNDGSAGCDAPACPNDSCPAINGTTDADEDGYPDDWELNGHDWDCDGNADSEFSTIADEGAHESFLLLAYMSEDCSDTSDNYQVTVHSHKPNAARLQLIQDAFTEGVGTAVVELRCIDHYTQVARGANGHNRDPDCNAVDDFIYFWQLKAAHFEPWRRGLYRFGLIAHGAYQPDITGEQQNDDACISALGKSGDAEINGDDFRVMQQNQTPYDPLDPYPPAVPLLSEIYTTFHEWGHTLGLEHGGFSGHNSKPNYQSGMNYRYSGAGELVAEDADTTDTAGPQGVIDFSGYQEDPLNEQILVETDVYVSKRPAGERRYMTWACPDIDAAFSYPYLPDGNEPYVDWNCDGAKEPPGTGDTGNASKDYDLDLDGDGAETTLHGHDDWSNLNNAAFCGSANDLSDSEPPGDRYRGMRPARVSVAPSCTGHAVPLDDSHRVRAVLYGSPAMPVSAVDPSTLGLAGARPRRARVVDVDLDGHDDIEMWFRPTTMSLLHHGSEKALFNAVTSNEVLWWATPAVDPDDWPDEDSDGVIDPCDQCLGTPGATDVGNDGCP
jgi:hypothetical protein